jgi:hypothetical protein
MNDREERASRPSQIPKRPTLQFGQPLAHPNNSFIQSNKVDNRSPLSEMETIKSEALRPQVPLERKKAANSYTAVVNGKTSGKPSFLAWATSFFLLK